METCAFTVQVVCAETNYARAQMWRVFILMWLWPERSWTGRNVCVWFDMQWSHGKALLLSRSRTNLHNIILFWVLNPSQVKTLTKVTVLLTLNVQVVKIYLEFTSLEKYSWLFACCILCDDCSVLLVRSFTTLLYSQSRRVLFCFVPTIYIPVVCTCKLIQELPHLNVLCHVYALLYHNN